MSIFVSFMQSIYRLLDTDMNIYGFSFSWWDVMLYTCIASALIRLVISIYDAL